MIKIPLYPEYSTLTQVLKILNGESVKDYKNMWTAICKLSGTPQNPVDWSIPDQWINERLTGTDRLFAIKIWERSNKTVNPRYVGDGAQSIMNGYNLIKEKQGVYELTPDGKKFISGPENEIMQKIDIEEGLIQILRQLSVIVTGKRADLLEEWEEYTKYNANIRQDSSLRDYLRRRIVNLVSRGYIKREGNIYTISDKGIKYLQLVEKSNPNPIVDKETQLYKEVEQFNKSQKELLREYLAKTTPYQFEIIIKDLLSSMGYEDVEVTSPTNDKGVDVTGVSQNGITTVKEVIQVKRNTTSNITRPILDGLRGCLHRFDAFQGTIITLSDFAKGAKDAAFEKGAAPITLINGDKLIELLMKNGVGMNKKVATYYVVDESYFEVSDIENN